MAKYCAKVLFGMVATVIIVLGCIIITVAKLCGWKSLSWTSSIPVRRIAEEPISC